MLAVLFVVRLTMAFQFQSVAAVAPLLGTLFGVSLADIGILIGLYFTPGVALALPGGAIGKWFGDKRTVLAALLLMLGGSLAMAAAESWSVQIAGRLVAGGGGVLLNVQMTKMVADWFAGKEIATAMAIFVNSWPAGVALSLLTLPLIGTAYGVSAVYLAVAALAAAGFVLLAIAYRSPQNLVMNATASARLDRSAAIAVTTAGLIWGLYNVGFAMIFSFGPTMLVERGRVCDADDRAAAQRRGGPDGRGARPGLRATGRTDPEPSCARAATWDASDRHGYFLHPLLCHDDVGADRRRRLRQMERKCCRCFRFRCRRAPDVPDPVVGVQSDSGT